MISYDNGDTLHVRKQGFHSAEILNILNIVSDILNVPSKERYISKDITLGCKEIIQILLIYYFFKGGGEE